jgi:hypothetical protein
MNSRIAKAHQFSVLLLGRLEVSSWLPHIITEIGKRVQAQVVERRIGLGWRRKEMIKFQEEEGHAVTEGGNEMRKWSHG